MAILNILYGGQFDYYYVLPTTTHLVDDNSEF